MAQGRDDPQRQGAARTAWRRPAIAAVALVVAAAPAVASAGTSDPGTAAQELLVRFTPTTGASARADARRDAGARFEERLPLRGLEVVRVESRTSAAAAERSLEDDPGVLYAEPNTARGAFRVPNDQYYGKQWGLDKIDAPEAWDVTTGDPVVTVAIVDSGVTRSHPDLAPNLWANPGESGALRQSNGLDDDGNGYVDDTAGWDWVDSDADPSDLNGHGTHVAGTIGARGDNGTGVTGVAWRTGLMPLRVLDADGSGRVADAISAYAYAGRAGARVVNASLGGSGFSRSESDTIRSLPGALFVVAAGNDGADNDSHPQYPCNYDLPNIVCVAATGQSDALAGFSNRGARTVDLAAPGVSILSTWTSGYAWSNGTSMATPHVSGAAALLFAHTPGATPLSVKDALLTGVDVLPGLAGTTVTGGRLNAYASLTGRRPAPAAPPASPGGTAPPAAAPDRIPPQLMLRVKRRQRLRTLLRRGIRVTVQCSEACSVQARALIRGRPRRAESIASAITMAGRDSARLSASGRRVLVIKLRRSAKRRLAHARRATVVVRVNAADGAGNARVATRRISVRRR